MGTPSGYRLGGDRSLKSGIFRQKPLCSIISRWKKTCAEINLIQAKRRVFVQLISGYYVIHGTPYIRSISLDFELFVWLGKRGLFRSVDLSNMKEQFISIWRGPRKELITVEQGEITKKDSQSSKLPPGRMFSPEFRNFSHISQPIYINLLHEKSSDIARKMIRSGVNTF